VSAVRLHRVTAVFLRYLYLLRGSPSRVFPLFIWVAIDMVLWGFLTRYLGGAGAFRFDLVTVLLGAVLLWDFMARVMHGVATAFFEDVWSRNFLNLFASPLRLSEYLAGLVLSSIATSTVGLGVMVAVAMPLFGLTFAPYGLMLGAFFLVLFLSGIALGIAGVALVLRLGPAAEWFIWPVPAMLAPFTCVFYPLAVLPAWMRPIARALPPTYVFEGMRDIVAGRPAPVAALAAGTLIALGCVVLAAWAFARVYRHAVRTGLISRYAAESAG